MFYTSQTLVGEVLIELKEEAKIFLLEIRH